LIRGMIACLLVCLLDWVVGRSVGWLVAASVDYLVDCSFLDCLIAYHYASVITINNELSG